MPAKIEDYALITVAGASCRQGLSESCVAATATAP
jgi:hypothetical protein